MNKEFIPFEQAFELYELGFDEPCFGWFDTGYLRVGNVESKHIQGLGELLAPLYQQAFRWFRENYGLSGWVNESFVGSSQGVISIKSEIGLKYHTAVTKLFDTYEEAELVCLRKLIEIVKSNNDTP